MSTIISDYVWPLLSILFSLVIVGAIACWVGKWLQDFCSPVAGVLYAFCHFWAAPFRFVLNSVRDFIEYLASRVNIKNEKLHRGLKIIFSPLSGAVLMLGVVIVTVIVKAIQGTLITFLEESLACVPIAYIIGVLYGEYNLADYAALVEVVVCGGLSWILKSRLDELLDSPVWGGFSNILSITFSAVFLQFLPSDWLAEETMTKFASAQSSWLFLALVPVLYLLLLFLGYMLREFVAMIWSTFVPLVVAVAACFVLQLWVPESWRETMTIVLVMGASIFSCFYRSFLEDDSFTDGIMEEDYYDDLFFKILMILTPLPLVFLIVFGIIQAYSQ